MIRILRVLFVAGVTAAVLGYYIIDHAEQYVASVASQGQFRFAAWDSGLGEQWPGSTVHWIGTATLTLGAGLLAYWWVAARDKAK